MVIILMPYKYIKGKSFIVLKLNTTRKSHCPLFICFDFHRLFPYNPNTSYRSINSSKYFAVEAPRRTVKVIFCFQTAEKRPFCFCLFSLLFSAWRMFLYYFRCCCKKMGHLTWPCLKFTVTWHSFKQKYSMLN